MNKVALITGITGQDGKYLAEYLLTKGYEVHGIIRRSSSINTGRIDHIFEKLNLHYGDLTDGLSLSSLVHSIAPDEIYNLGAQSHVQVSFETPEYTAQVDGIGVLRLLEAVRSSSKCKHTRIYQASTSEMFGSSPAPQNEFTPMHPCSPYGSAKLYAYWICKNYREAYNMHVSCGILFNHESPERGATFITRKISRAVARIHHNLQESVTIGNLEAKRDWGDAREYIEVMWLMLQQEIPDDYVIATGKCYTVRDLVELAFTHIGLIIKWEMIDGKETGVDQNNIIRVKLDNKYIRKNEVNELRGDPSKAERVLGWKAKVSFASLLEDMIQHDLRLSKN